MKLNQIVAEIIVTRLVRGRESMEFSNPTCGLELQRVA